MREREKERKGERERGWRIPYEIKCFVSLRLFHPELCANNSLFSAIFEFQFKSRRRLTTDERYRSYISIIARHR